MVQEIIELRDAVRPRTIVDLVEIAIDPTVPRDGLLRCVRCVSDFESMADAVLNDAWIPKTVPQITRGILCMTENLRKMRLDLDAALDSVLDDARPDSIFRCWMSLNFERLLEQQREILVRTAMKIMDTKWVN